MQMKSYPTSVIKKLKLFYLHINNPVSFFATSLALNLKSGLKQKTAYLILYEMN
jgi:hypothetical protein